MNPARLRQLFEQATAALQQGRSDQAEAPARALLKGDPGFTSNHLMGVITLQLGRAGEAVEYFRTALKLQPGETGTMINLGLALLHGGRAQDALAPLDQAVAAAPNLPDAWYNRGLVLAACGHITEALASYERALSLAPGAAAVWADRGAVLMALGRHGDAVDSFDRALPAMPGNADLLAHRGIALMTLGRADAALASYDRALALAPGDPRLWDSRGMALWQLNRLPEAHAAFDKAIAVAPDFAAALNHRGTLLWSALEQPEAARRDLERAVALDPAQPYALGELLHLKFYGAEWAGTAALKAQLEAGVRQGRAVIRPFAFAPVSQSSADSQACARQFAHEMFPVSQAWTATPPHAREKLRLGYVSGEFHEQATALLMAGLYEAHDRDRFEIVAIDNGIDDGSAMRARLVQAFDRLVVIAGLDDARAVAQVRAEQIDILVNLNGWFGRHRTVLFAQRCAPIQVNYLGFPGTMGAPFMDYILADGVVIPPDDEAFYDEQVVRLPHSYQANDDKRALGPATTRAAQGLPDNAFVFCNFNQSYKIHPESFAVWMQLLHAVPDSRLWLLAGPAGFAENLRREAKAAGIDGERLIFAPLLPHDQHLARLKLADLFVDCLPYNAHTTASDALWAGVPLVTCRGTTFPGRVAASLLTAAGLSELITENWGEYRALAVSLAQDRARLAALRRRLAVPGMLFDTKSFTRHIEAAYRTMWDIHGQAQPPRAFDVPA